MGSRNLHNNAFNTVPKLDAKIGDGISSLEANIYNYTRLKWIFIHIYWNSANLSKKRLNFVKKDQIFSSFLAVSIRFRTLNNTFSESILIYMF